MGVVASCVNACELIERSRFPCGIPCCFIESIVGRIKFLDVKQRESEKIESLASFWIWVKFSESLDRVLEVGFGFLKLTLFEGSPAEANMRTVSEASRLSASFQ